MIHCLGFNLSKSRHVHARWRKTCVECHTGTCAAVVSDSSLPHTSQSRLYPGFRIWRQTHSQRSKASQTPEKGGIYDIYILHLLKKKKKLDGSQLPTSELSSTWQHRISLPFFRSPLTLKIIIHLNLNYNLCFLFIN